MSHVHFVPFHVMAHQLLPFPFTGIFHRSLFGLLPDQFKMLKLEYVKKNQVGQQCAICLEEYSLRQHIYMLPCKHIFHKKCINPWFSTNKSCPICRADIDVLLQRTAPTAPIEPAPPAMPIPTIPPNPTISPTPLRRVRPRREIPPSDRQLRSHTRRQARSPTRDRTRSPTRDRSRSPRILARNPRSRVGVVIHLIREIRTLDGERRN